MNKITRNITAILTIGLGSTLIANAQVTSQKIGTNPTMKQPSAVLEVESANKGVLMPRVTLTSITDAVTIANPANALTVFNTATAGTAPNDVTPGYYYWSTADSRWVRLVDKLPQNVNIYNADGTLTDYRIVSGTEKWLTFQGTSGAIEINGNNLRSANTTGGITNLYYRGNIAGLIAQGTSDMLDIRTHDTTNPAPITFGTSEGGGHLSEERMRIEGTGNVGIAENDPTEKLDVGSGNVRVRDINANIGISTDRVVVSDTDGVLKTIPASTFAATNIYNADGVVTDPRTATLDGNKLTFLGSSQQTSVNSDGSMSIETLTGNVGSALNIDGADNDADGSVSSLQIQVFSDSEARIYAVNDTSNLTLGTSGNITSAPIIFHTAPGGEVNGSERMRITGEGNVGIAESNPTEKLDVGAGNVRVRDIFASAGNTATDRVVVADVDGVLKTAAITDLNTNLYTNDGTLAANRTVTTNSNFLRFTGNSNTVGINNSGTQARLSATGGVRGSLGMTGGSGASASTLELYTDASTLAQINASGAGSTGLSIGTTVATPMTFKTDGTNRMILTSTGELAIGATSAPSFTVGATTIQPKLHVAGDISTTGKVWTTNSVYADYVFEKYFKGNSDIKPDYEFKSLDYVKEFIEKEHHLPGVEPIADLAKAENGYTFDMTKLTVQSLEKIEELYLHTIELKEKLDVQYQMGQQQEKMIQSQQKELEELKNKFSRLEELLIKQ